MALAAGGALAIALAVSVNADATLGTPDLLFDPGGSLTIAWHGEPGRGCAGEGLCGVTGSLRIAPSANADAGSSSGPPLVYLFAKSVARVDETFTGSAVSNACADPVPVGVVLAIERVRRVLRAVVSRDVGDELPSSGRCAGPTAQDLSAISLPARKLRRGGYNLSGQTSFGAGPFTVTVSSKLRVSVARTAARHAGFQAQVRGRTRSPAAKGSRRGIARNEQINIGYRVQNFADTLTTTFAGLPAPSCDRLGACGTAGELSDLVTGSGLSFLVSGFRTVHRRTGTRAALADLRAGRDMGEGALNGQTTSQVTETLRGPDGGGCNDLGPAMAFDVDGSITRAGLVLEATAELAAFPITQLSPGTAAADADPWRTRCAGPSSADISRGGPVASATIPRRELGARQLTVTFVNTGLFQGASYDGARTGSIVLTLQRVLETGGTSL